MDNQSHKLSLCSIKKTLHAPGTNKGVAFDEGQRAKLGLQGFLPHTVISIEQQADGAYQQFLLHENRVAKHLYLYGLLNRNETLFYHFVAKHAEEMLPLIYTPIVGDMALHYSAYFQEPMGLYLSYPMKDKLDEILSRYDADCDVIVVTDGERVLGLGDQGIGGMAICIGKLALYTIFGGINPKRTLPIYLDCGTDNPELLANQNYLGWQHARVKGEELDGFVDAFVKAIKKRFPKVLLQWEDFAKGNARRFLMKYRKEICSFNDDIQGTATVVLAALYVAVKLSGKKLEDQRVVVVGAGSAGVGICDALELSIREKGISAAVAKKCFYIVDRKGLVHQGLNGHEPHVSHYARETAEVISWGYPSTGLVTLKEVVKHAKPTILIGVCAQGGMFTQEIIEEMAKHTEHPIVFPLSNPTSKTEAIPQDIMEWTKGKALIATGSPFDPVKIGNKSFKITQCNNVYIFPGVGLGIISSEATEVTEGMFLQPAEALSKVSPRFQDETEGPFPPLKNLRQFAREIAFQVGMQAMKEKVAPSRSEADLKARIEKNIWHPTYS